MAINVSGGMANARARQLRAAKGKNPRRHIDKKKAEEAQDPNRDDAFEEDPRPESHQTKLGKLLAFIDPFIVVLIILNAIQMGVATFNFVEKNSEIDHIFELVDQIFLIIFTIEVSLNFVHLVRLDRITVVNGKYGFSPFTEEEMENMGEDRKWLIFDALVVILSWAFASLSIIRAFRILRLLRLIKKVENLKNVVGALLSIGPKMGVVAFMLAICFLVFGIAFTNMFGDLYADGYTKHDYFSSLDLTFFTLFQIMTFDNWHPIARATMEKYPSSWVLYLIWNIITGFVIMNLIIAIICESLVKLTEKKNLERARLEGEERKNELTSSRKSIGDASVYSIDHINKIEDVVDDILEDQEMLLETVEKLKVAIEDVLDNSSKSNDIRQILMSFPSARS